MPRWEWSWVYTRAQLQIIACDATLTVYKAREKPQRKSGEYRKPDKEKMEEAYRKWKLRKAQGAFSLKKFLGGKRVEGEDRE